MYYNNTILVELSYLILHVDKYLFYIYIYKIHYNGSIFTPVEPVIYIFCCSEWKILFSINIYLGIIYNNPVRFLCVQGV